MPFIKPKQRGMVILGYGGWYILNVDTEARPSPFFQTRKGATDWIKANNYTQVF